MLDENDSVTFRLITENNNVNYESERFNVTINDTRTAQNVSTPSVSSIYTQNTSVKSPKRRSPNSDVYSITVNFLYEDGSEAFQNLYANYSASQSINREITLETLNGYTPVIRSSTPMDGFETEIDLAKSILKINVQSLNEDITINVVYEANLVDYTVNYYLQNLDDDEYSLDETVTKQAKVGYNIVAKDIEKNYDGFSTTETALPTVAADGSTRLDIYYNRNYYKITFELNGGTGERDIFVKYGTTITVADPTKVGYTFSCWCSDKDCLTPAELPKTMPASSDLIYYAKWIPAETTYSIAVWIENSFDDEYSFYKIIKENCTATSESSISIDDPSIMALIEQSMSDEPIYKHLTINKDLCSPIVSVNGDGSSTLNVYFKRKIYALRFFYARKRINADDTYTWEVPYQNTQWSNNSGLSGNIYDELSFQKIYWDQTTNNQPPQFTDEFKSLIDGEYSANDDKVGIYNGSYTHTATNGKKEFLFIVLKAKYGQDLRDLWPSSPFENIDTTKRYNSFISWGTRYDSPYQKSHTNPNIKGPYSEMDDNMINDDPSINYTDKDSFAQDFVAYWNTGHTYIYQIYFSALSTDTDDPDDDNDYVYYDGIEKRNGNPNAGDRGKPGYYKLHESINILSNDNALAQTELNFKGMKCNVKEDIGLDSSQANASGGIIKFFYQRETKQITFDNGYKSQIVVDIPYGENLANYQFSDYKEITLMDDGTTSEKNAHSEVALYLRDIHPIYPEAMNKGQLEFSGEWYQGITETQTSWHVVPETKIDLSDIKNTIGESNIILYPKWDTKKYTATFYTDPDKTKQLEAQQFEYGGVLKTPENTPKNGWYLFDGWYYIDDNEVEQRVSFYTTQFYHDINIYAKWKSESEVPYTIYYKIYGEDTEIASPTNGIAPGNSTMTFSAKAGNELYSGYINGYYPVDNTSTSIMMDPNKSDKVTYTFYYRESSTPIKYKVRFVEFLGLDPSGSPIIGNDDIADPRIYNNDENLSVVTVVPRTFENYTLVSATGDLGYYRITKTLTYAESGTITEANTFYFYYIKKNSGTYIVQHYCQSFDGTYELKNEVTMSGVIGYDYTAEPDNFPGYRYNDKAPDEKKSGTIVDGSTPLVLRLYYDAMKVNIEKKWDNIQAKDIEFKIYKNDGGVAVSEVGNFEIKLSEGSWNKTVYLPYPDASYHYSLVESSKGYLTVYDPPEQVTVDGKVINAAKIFESTSGETTVTVTNSNLSAVTMPSAGLQGIGNIHCIIGFILIVISIGILLIRVKLNTIKIN